MNKQHGIDILDHTKVGGHMDKILISDVGTTSIKTSLFDSQLNCLGTVSGEYKINSGSNGIIELNPETYWSKFCVGVKAVCEKCNIDVSEISRIGITTQGETLIPVDENGKSLRNAIVWLDTRAKKEAEEIASNINLDEFYSLTGISECTAVSPICKLLWISRHEKDIYEKTKYFLLLEDYLIMRLTGQFVSNKSVSCTTGYYDILNDRLWTEILDKFELEPKKIPEILDCGTLIGPVRPEICDEIGFSQNAIVFTTAMDQVSSALGAGIVEPGLIAETTGTVVAIATVSDRQILLAPEHVTTYWHALKEQYLVCPICMTGGMVLKWFKDEFCSFEQTEANRLGISPYELLDELAANSPVLSNGVITIPYFNGSHQPYFCPEARGVFFGIGLENTKGDFVRSIFESIAYMIMENIEMLTVRYNIKPQKLLSCGGGSRSSIWNQIKANVTGLPTYSKTINETASLGAAGITLLHDCGEEYVIDLLNKANPIKNEYLPDMNVHEVYVRAYEKFHKIFQALKDQF